MSIHAGFPDLTKAARAALVTLLGEVKTRPDEVTNFCKAAKLNANGLKVRLQQYDRLKDAVLVQFPETREEITDSILRKEGMTSTQLRQTLKLIDRECCLVMGTDIKELNYYLATGGVSPILAGRSIPKGRKK